MSRNIQKMVYSTHFKKSTKNITFLIDRQDTVVLTCKREREVQCEYSRRVTCAFTARQAWPLKSSVQTRETKGFYLNIDSTIRSAHEYTAYL